MNEVIPASNVTSSVTTEKLVAAFLSGRKANTLRAYSEALADFATYIDAGSIEEAARRLLSSHPGDANAMVLDYRTHLQERGLVPASVNLRLAAIRSLVKLGRMLGIVAWSLEIPNLGAQAYRDTRGPGKDGVKAMLTLLEAKKPSPKAIRDIAIIRLMFDRALRRGEVAAMNVNDIDPAGRVRIIGKGKTQGEWLTIPKPTFDALIDWLSVRGVSSGPLFINLDSVMETGRLSTNAIYDMVRAVGNEALHRHVRPHGLRHAGITHALDKTSGNVRAVAKFARHSRVDMTIRYDDNRQDVGGQIAGLVAE